MPEIKTHKDKMLHRIRIIKGHIAAIEKMIDQDKYCVDIMHQSMAVQKALKELDVQMMKNHLNTCVVHQVKNGENEKMVDDLIGLYKFK